MTASGEMGTIKGFDVAKMANGKNTSVGLWTFMTMSEKMMWLNETIAVAVFVAADAMWQEFKIEIYEWA